jgi:hypothetical protein
MVFIVKETACMAGLTELRSFLRRLKMFHVFRGIAGIIGGNQNGQ